MKRRTFLMWSQAEKDFRRSQNYHQRVSKHRFVCGNGKKHSVW